MPWKQLGPFRPIHPRWFFGGALFLVPFVSLFVTKYLFDVLSFISYYALFAHLWPLIGSLRNDFWQPELEFRRIGTFLLQPFPSGWRFLLLLLVLCITIPPEFYQISQIQQQQQQMTTMIFLFLRKEKHYKKKPKKKKKPNKCLRNAQ